MEFLRGVVVVVFVPLLLLVLVVEYLLALPVARGPWTVKSLAVGLLCSTYKPPSFRASKYGPLSDLLPA